MYALAITVALNIQLIFPISSGIMDFIKTLFLFAFVYLCKKNKKKERFFFQCSHSLLMALQHECPSYFFLINCMFLLVYSNINTFIDSLALNSCFLFPILQQQVRFPIINILGSPRYLVNVS